MSLLSYATKYVVEAVIDNLSSAHTVIMSFPSQNIHTAKIENTALKQYLFKGKSTRFFMTIYLSIVIYSKSYYQII